MSDPGIIVGTEPRLSWVVRRRSRAGCIRLCPVVEKNAAPAASCRCSAAGPGGRSPECANPTLRRGRGYKRCVLGAGGQPNTGVICLHPPPDPPTRVQLQACIGEAISGHAWRRGPGRAALVAAMAASSSPSLAPIHGHLCGLGEVRDEHLIKPIDEDAQAGRHEPGPRVEQRDRQRCRTKGA